MQEKLQQILVIVATVGMIVFNWLAATGILGGVDTGAISDKYDTHITPAGYAFAIWSLIYLGMIAFSIYQALPSQAAKISRFAENLYHQLCRQLRVAVCLESGINCSLSGNYHRPARFRRHYQRQTPRNRISRRILAGKSAVRNLFRLGDGGNDFKCDHRARLSRRQIARCDIESDRRRFDPDCRRARYDRALEIEKLFLSAGNRVGFNGNRRQTERANHHRRRGGVRRDRLFGRRRQFCDGYEIVNKSEHRAVATCWWRGRSPRVSKGGNLNRQKFQSK